MLRIFFFRVSELISDPVVLYLAVHSVIMAQIDQNSMTIPIQLQIGKKTINANALIDSGTGGIFINKDFVEKHNLFIKELTKPLTAFNVDGTVNKQGTNTHAVKGVIDVDNHAM